MRMKSKSPQNTRAQQWINQPNNTRSARAVGLCHMSHARYVGIPCCRADDAPDTSLVVAAATRLADGGGGG